MIDGWKSAELLIAKERRRHAAAPQCQIGCKKTNNFRS